MSNPALAGAPAAQNTANPNPIGVSGSGGFTPPPAAPAASPGATPPDWTSSFNDDLKGYVQNKGFKDPGSVLESYRNLEKHLGAPKERILQLPEKSDDPAWNEIYGKLGRPEKADDYKIEIPQGHGDEKFASWAKGTFHELGLSAKQAETLAQKWNGYVAEGLQAQTATQQAEAFKQDQALQQKWGAAYNQNIGIAQEAMRKFGVDETKIDQLESVLGYGGVIELLYNIGSKTSEDTFVGGNGAGGANRPMSPEAAKQELARLSSDKGWMSKWLAGDKEARELKSRLVQYMNPA